MVEKIIVTLKPDQENSFILLSRCMKEAKNAGWDKST